MREVVRTAAIAPMRVDDEGIDMVSPSLTRGTVSHVFLSVLRSPVDALD